MEISPIDMLDPDLDISRSALDLRRWEIILLPDGYFYDNSDVIEELFSETCNEANFLYFEFGQQDKIERQKKSSMTLREIIEKYHYLYIFVLCTTQDLGAYYNPGAEYVAIFGEINLMATVRTRINIDEAAEFINTIYVQTEEKHELARKYIESLLSKYR